MKMKESFIADMGQKLLFAQNEKVELMEQVDQ